MKNPELRTHITVLLVEDDRAHAAIVRRNLPGFPFDLKLIHVVDWQMALDYLLCSVGLNYPTTPDLILLDLHIPKMAGSQALRQIMSLPELKTIPTIILTSSSLSSDRDAAYALGAMNYQPKPMSSERFAEMLGVLLADRSSLLPYAENRVPQATGFRRPQRSNDDNRRFFEYR